MKNFLAGIKTREDKDIIIGFTSVVGDLLHAGHVAMLDECKLYCDYLYVGMINDPTIDRPEKNKPIQSLFERYVQVSSNRNVDEVIPLSGEKDLVLALQTLPINVRFVGVDYFGKDFTGKTECNDLGIEIIYNRRNHGLSSTELRKRIKEIERLKGE
jgi:glycerol-3-phosphate cytidylyltransferase